MLATISKKRGERIKQEVGSLIQSGLALVRKQLYKQAGLDFNRAFKISPSVTKVMLEKHYKHFKHGENFSATLAIGLVLLKINTDDYRLANVLGNCSRKDGKYKQANDLYRHALKLQKNFSTAYYNLAASMGKVDLYDMDIRVALDRFTSEQEYILPDYAVTPDFTKKIIAKLAILKQKAKDKKIQKLLEEQEKREANNELLQVHRLKNLIEKEKKYKPVPAYDDVCKYIKLMIRQLNNNNEKENPENNQQENSENNQPKASKNTQQELDYYYNLCLYALENDDGKQAGEALEKIKLLGGKYEFYDMLQALAHVMKDEVNQGIQLFIKLLGKDQTNRFYNINLGLVYRHLGNKLLSYKYLLIGSVLLEKSEGLYKLSDLMTTADEHLSNGRTKKALELYEVIVSEEDNSEVWEKIGKIYMELEKFVKAAEAFHSLQKIVPKSSVASDNLTQIHDLFVEEAEELFRGRKYKSAAAKFETALKVLRLPKTLKRAAAVYTVLCDKKRATELMDECEEIKKTVHEEGQEQLRQKYIEQGKKFRKSNMTKKAIESFELAFRLKLDKDVFMILAHLYKSNNRLNELQDLLGRWNKMVELEDRMKQYKK
jgi:Flp pilus assembly protein TadD